uniref:Uncharacterized protein n=1 Tax=Eptatretus burgeri TaxID=7764 RepID=A0A8C4NKJ2_EPTBU
VDLTMANGMEETFSLRNTKIMPDLLQELCELRLTGSFCDVVVEVQSRRYLAHKAVLSSTCRYFRSMLFSVPCSSLGPLVVDFLSVPAFERVLDFLYRGEAQAGRRDVRELHQAARSLGLDALEQACFPLLELVAGDEVEEGPTTTSPYDPETSEHSLSEIAQLVRRGKMVAGTAVQTEGASPDDDHGGEVTACHIEAEAVGQGECDNSSPHTGCQFSGSSRRVEESCYNGAGDVCQLETHDASMKVATVKTEQEDDYTCRFSASATVTNSASAGATTGQNATFTSTDPGYNVIGAEGKYMAGGGYNRMATELASSVAPCVESGTTGSFVHCQVCGEPLVETESSLREHAVQHVNRETLECRVCGRKFSLFNRAVEHVLSHAGVNIVSCADCGKKLLSHTRLNLHLKSCKMRRASLASAPPWAVTAVGNVAAGCMPCQVCGAAVVKKMSLVRKHARMHVDMNKLTCEVCGLHTSSSGNLVKHTLLHIGVFLFECDICGKGFPFQSLLQQHQKRRCVMPEAGQAITDASYVADCSDPADPAGVFDLPTAEFLPPPAVDDGGQDESFATQPSYGIAT